MPTSFRNWIKNDNSAEFQAEPNRYHIYVSFACPWAHRTLLAIKLKGLDHVISYSTVDWLLDMTTETGWTFSQQCPDPHHPEFTHLRQIYQFNDPNFDETITVPVLFDLKTQKVVNNESAEIIRMINSEFNAYAKNKHVDLYPEALRSKIDQLNDEIFKNLNVAVYHAGFATTQTDYENAFNNIFAMLDKLEMILGKQRYLVDNENLVETDVRAWTTLLRFDLVYVTHFKCNKRLITKDYPNLYNYVCDIYQMSGIKETVNIEHIKKHYFVSHNHINPSRIVPCGPDINFDKVHGRENLSKL